MIYDIRTLDAAIKALKRLDKPVAKRVISRIQWLAENLDSVEPQPLKENLSGLYKLRVGDYRVVYRILEEERMIVVHLVGHRREIYKLFKNES